MNRRESIGSKAKRLHCKIMKRSLKPGRVSSPSKILDGLYLGSRIAASNPYKMKMLNVRRVVNMNQSVRYPSTVQSVFFVKGSDVPSFQIRQHFRSTIEFIDQGLKRGETVLIHCRAGISRSATICIAYIMAKFGMKAEEAIDFVQARRKILLPNIGFIEQLLAFETKLFGSQ